ncbi:MAG: hypothetical protein HON94_16260 [Methylococcales bacterium]|mgnify:CR=1 FL=1|nr:hypothetical protein [Methylococcales bacterium]MBT7410880.1 hypothetical protein [Methylococcales bacterium]
MSIQRHRLIWGTILSSMLFAMPVVAEELDEDVTESTEESIESMKQPRISVLQSVILEKVTANFRQAGLKEIVAWLAPKDWAVDVQVKNPAQLHAIIDFTAETTRYQAFYDLLTPLKLKAFFYPNMMDKNDQLKPLIVIAEEQK